MKIIRLVNKAQKGDDKAFLKLFQKYEEDIFEWLMYMSKMKVML